MGDILSDDETFFCIFIVDDAYQRRGIGNQLFRRCLEARGGGGRNITFFAIQKGAPYYKKHFGFKPQENPCIQSLSIFKPDKSALDGRYTVECLFRNPNPFRN